MWPYWAASSWLNDRENFGAATIDLAFSAYDPACLGVRAVHPTLAAGRTTVDVASLSPRLYQNVACPYYVALFFLRFMDSCCHRWAPALVD